MLVEAEVELMLSHLLVVVLAALLLAAPARAQSVCAILNGGATAVLGVVPCGQTYNPASTTIGTSDSRYVAFQAQLAAQNAGRAFLAQYQAQIAIGVALTSTGTPSLNATYPLDAGTLDNINGLYFRAKTIGTNFAPGGGSSVQLVDVTGSYHTFNSAQIINYGDAIATYLASCAPQVVGPPGNHGFPSNAATIP